MHLPEGETVTRLRRTRTTDPYSGRETLDDWTDPDKLRIEECAFGRRESSEQNGRVIETAVLVAPYGVDIRAEDRIKDCRGNLWHCTADPVHARNPFTGWEAGSTTKLRKVQPDGR